MDPMWKDGILFMIRKANEAIEARQFLIGRALLETAFLAQRQADSSMSRDTGKRTGAYDPLPYPDSSACR